MTNDALGKQIDSLEAQLSDLAVLMLGDDAQQIHQCSAGLQALAKAISDSGIGKPRSEWMPYRARLQALAQDLAIVRVQLARKQAYVEQGLRQLIPAATQAATYAGTKSLYAGAGRSSGSLRSLSA